jgi:hypothetical protein
VLGKRQKVSGITPALRSVGYEPASLGRATTLPRGVAFEKCGHRPVAGFHVRCGARPTAPRAGALPVTNCSKGYFKFQTTEKMA